MIQKKSIVSYNFGLNVFIPEMQKDQNASGIGNRLVKKKSVSNLVHIKSDQMMFAGVLVEYMRAKRVENSPEYAKK